MKTVTENLPQRPSRDTQEDGDDVAAQFVHMPSPKDDWSAPNLRDLRAELEYPEAERNKAWKHYREEVQKYYETLLKRWQKEMDNLLVFGGLFSAVLTPFNVESYKTLRPDPTDPSLAILQQISAQLNSFTLNSAFANSTTPFLPLADIEPAFRASRSAVVINQLWFSSLICSLASASIALIMKQWLLDLSAGLTGESRQVARRRQYRYNAMRKWHVGTIRLVPFLLLQVALILFLSGLLVLLWTLHTDVAAVSSALAGALFVFLIAVTILPSFFVDCCYGSPLARLLYPVVGFVLRQISDPLFSFLQSRVPSSIPSARRLSRLYGFLASGAVRSPTWRSREERPVLNEAKSLDCSTAIMAFTTTFDDAHIGYLPVILQDLPATQLADAFNDIANAHWWQSQSLAELSHLDKQQRVLERPLIRAIGCLLTDPRFVIKRQELAGERRYHVAPVCASLLSQLSVSESTDKNNVLGVLGPAFNLHDEEVSRLAYNILLDVLDLCDGGEPLSYVSIRYALSALEEKLKAQWDKPQSMSYDLAVVDQLRAVRAIVLCVLEALSTKTPLSPTETRIVCDHANRLLSIFTRNWSSLQWLRLLPARPPASRGPSHSLSLDLQRYLWPALVPLSDNPRSCIVVPKDMTSTLKEALSKARFAQDKQGGRGLPPIPALLDLLANSKLDYIENALKESSRRFGV